jgi:alanine dehydrogenase
LNTQLLLLSRSEVQDLISLPECISAMEAAFRLYHQGQALSPALMHVAGDGADFHIKGGGLRYDQTFFALKAGGINFENMAKRNLPNIMGLILLFDGVSGQPLAAMDAMYITFLRTGATTALAARYLARPDSSTVTICGCGKQGRAHLAALREVFPAIRKVYAWDANPAAVQDFVGEAGKDPALQVEGIAELPEGTLKSDIVVTCTPSKKYYLCKDMIRPGTFVGAVGADSPSKQELEPALLAGSRLIVDILDHCVHNGELHHALDARVMAESDVAGDLGAVVSGQVQGRTSPQEVTIYDATGSAIQDTAAAVWVYRRALAKHIGIQTDLFA